MKIKITPYSFLGDADKIKKEIEVRIEEMKNTWNNCYWREIKNWRKIKSNRYQTSCRTERDVEEFEYLNFCPYCGGAIVWMN